MMDSSEYQCWLIFDGKHRVSTARFTLPGVSEHISPLFGAIPLQFIGYYLARACGANPDRSQDVGDPARFRAAQLLARRGELAANFIGSGA